LDAVAAGRAIADSVGTGTEAFAARGTRNGEDFAAVAVVGEVVAGEAVAAEAKSAVVANPPRNNV
jgi:hypothetical protein